MRKALFKTVACQDDALRGEGELRNFILALLLFGAAALGPTSGFAASTLGIEDIPRIIKAGEARFHKDYKGRLYTARMTVNDVMDRSTFYAVGFNINGNNETFPPISCKIHDVREVGSAREGAILWVSGILEEIIGDTIFLDPCEISFTKEPSVVPQPWKTHPPRQ